MKSVAFWGLGLGIPTALVAVAVSLPCFTECSTGDARPAVSPTKAFLVSAGESGCGTGGCCPTDAAPTPETVLTAAETEAASCGVSACEVIVCEEVKVEACESTGCCTAGETETQTVAVEGATKSESCCSGK